MFTQQFDELAEMRAQQDAVLQNVKFLVQFLRKFRDADGQRFGQRTVVPGQAFTILEALLFVERSLKTFQSIRLTKNAPIPAANWRDARSLTSDIFLYIENMRGLFGLIESSDISNVISHSGSQLTRRSSGEIFVDMTDICIRVVSTSDAFLQSSLVIRSAVEASKVARNIQESENVSDDAAACLAAALSAEATARDLRNLHAEMTASEAASALARASMEVDLQNLMQSAQDDIANLSSMEVSASTALTQVIEDAAVATSKRDEVDRILVHCEDSHREIDKFAESVPKIEARIVTAHSIAEKAVNNINGQQDRVDDLIAAAEKMVSGATVAGLAKAFADERTGLEKSMGWAMAGFGTGIALLMAASSVLAIYVLNVHIPGLEWLGPKVVAGKAAEPTVAGVFSRAIIIIGPFWLTLFSARRYRSLFDLRQQYSHKYTMAFSMEGFKTQAPEFGERIAAWVFSIVAENPVMQPPGKSMDAPPPVSVEGIMNEIKQRFDKVMISK